MIPQETRRSSLALIAILLLVTVDVASPLALAYHAGRGAAPVLPQSSARIPFVPAVTRMIPTVEIPNETQELIDSTQYPTLIHARETILAQQARAIRELDENLTRLGVHALAPALPAPVLVDRVGPGERVGGIGEWKVLGEGWRTGATDGVNASPGFTVRAPDEDTYPTMDSVIVSPAIDLSAYPLQTGTLPFLAAGTATDQINLIIRLILPACHLAASCVLVRCV